MSARRRGRRSSARPSPHRARSWPRNMQTSGRASWAGSWACRSQKATVSRPARCWRRSIVSRPRATPLERANRSGRSNRRSGHRASRSARAEADMAAAEARVRDAEQQLKRKRELSAEQLVAASELDTAKAAADTAVSAVRGCPGRNRPRPAEPGNRGAAYRAGSLSAGARPRRAGQDLHRVAHRRRRHPPARPQRRDGRGRYSEPAGHDADDHLRPWSDRRGGQGGRSRHPERGAGPEGGSHARGAAWKEVQREGGRDWRKRAAGHGSRSCASSGSLSGSTLPMPGCVPG